MSWPWSPFSSNTEKPKQHNNKEEPESDLYDIGSISDSDFKTLDTQKPQHETQLFKQVGTRAAKKDSIDELTLRFEIDYPSKQDREPSLDQAHVSDSEVMGKRKRPKMDKTPCPHDDTSVSKWCAIRGNLNELPLSQRRGEQLLGHFKKGTVQQLNKAEHRSKTVPEQATPGMITIAQHNRDIRAANDQAHREMSDLHGEIAYLKKERDEAVAELEKLKDKINELNRRNQLQAKQIKLRSQPPALRSPYEIVEPVSRQKPYQIEQLEHSVQILEKDRDKYKRWYKDLDERRVEAEQLLQNANTEVKRLQSKEYEATRKSTVLLDEDAQKEIESIFGQRIRTWARLSFRGLKKEIIIPIIELINESGRFNNVLYFSCFIAPIPLVLDKIGPVAFFEALVASTLTNKFFRDPFFLCNPGFRDNLMTLRDSANTIDQEAVCHWTSRTVGLLEHLAGLREQMSLSMDQLLAREFPSDFGETLAGYMECFMQQNKKLDETKIQDSKNKLIGIVQDCVKLALDWHKREMSFGLIDIISLGINDNTIIQDRQQDRQNLNAYCTIHKGTDEDAGLRGHTMKVLGIITPGFTKLTDPEGRCLANPIIWSKAVIALIEEEEEIAMEDALEPSGAPMQSNLSVEIVQVCGTPEAAVGTDIDQSQLSAISRTSSCDNAQIQEIMNTERYAEGSRRTSFTKWFGGKKLVQFFVS
ncbi:hypothetical protein ABW20_dc0100509 [Dactylellina cionopaga]|nr:hypothetical protein ABW20_dc0100509 [Dactylellina cionopaga]